MKKIILFIIVFSINNYVANADYSSHIMWGKNKKPVIVYDKQLDILINRWYSLTRILDILALKTNECNDYEWKCIWYHQATKTPMDYGHFQINVIHKEIVEKTKENWDNPKLHFKIQLTYVNKLLDSYEKWYCSTKSIVWKYWYWSNQLRVECIGRLYNWSSFKKSYWQWTWLKRENLKKYVKDYINNKK